MVRLEIMMKISKYLKTFGLSFGLIIFSFGPVQADQVINDNLIVTAGTCVGNDCVNNETFGVNTLILKENNTRILLDDTSSEPGFASQDWWLIANESVNGGSNFFAVSDSDILRTEDVTFDFTTYIDSTYGYLKSFPPGIWIPIPDSPDLSISYDAGGTLQCRDGLGTAIPCPTELIRSVAVSHPEELDFVVDPGNNSFHIQQDAVLVGSSTDTRLLSHVADGVEAQDVISVSQLDNAQVALDAVTAFGDTPVAGAVELQTDLLDAQTTLTAVAGRIDTVESVATDNTSANAAITQSIIDLQPRVTANSEEIATLQQTVSFSLSSDSSAASATGTGSTAIGGGASARTRDTAIGYMATVTADGSVAVGANTLVESANSVSVGADSHVALQADGGVALGQNAQVNQNASGAVAIGQNSIASEADTVSVGSTGAERRITNVAMAEAESDLINYAQLQSLSSNLQKGMERISIRIHNIDKRIDDIGALTAAFSALVPNTHYQGKTQISMGCGYYSGSNAIAAGFFHSLTENILLNAGVSTAFASNSTAFQTGVTVTF